MPRSRSTRSAVEGREVVEGRVPTRLRADGLPVVGAARVARGGGVAWNVGPLVAALFADRIHVRREAHDRRVGEDPEALRPDEGRENGRILQRDRLGELGVHPHGREKQLGRPSEGAHPTDGHVGQVAQDAGAVTLEGGPVKVRPAHPEGRVCEEAQHARHLEAEGEALSRLERVDLQDRVGRVVGDGELVRAGIDGPLRALVPVLRARSVRRVRVDVGVGRLEAEGEPAEARGPGGVEGSRRDGVAELRHHVRPRDVVGRAREGSAAARRKALRRRIHGRSQRH